MVMGYFGASTGGAAALVAAAELGDRIKAVVSRGGRPDLAGSALPLVTAPTLLIVGALDSAVIAMNRAAASQLRCEKSLQIVPGATHLFEEPGTLEEVSYLAADWFARHFPQSENLAGSKHLWSLKSLKTERTPASFLRKN
jgi:pimeloyl-ACP methyl ester carboxylesterase